MTRAKKPAVDPAIPIPISQCLCFMCLSLARKEICMVLRMIQGIEGDYGREWQP